METMHFKGYEGTADVDIERDVLRGKILFIDDLVTYEAATAPELKKEFQLAVDDYIETCKEIGKEPEKPFKGAFNVRISPELHKKAARRALKDNHTLNELVTRAIDLYVNALSDTNHNINVTVKLPENAVTTLVSSTDQPTNKPQWQQPEYVKH